MVTSWFTLVFLAVAEGSLLTNEDVERLQKYNVIPDIIPKEAFARVDVTYGDNLLVDMGNEFSTEQVHEPPTKISYAAEQGAYYTMIVTDPDVPASIGGTSIQHLLIVNIPEDETEKGETIWQYIGASPPEDTGFHRYVFQVYKQQVRLEKTDYAQLTDEKLGKLDTRIRNTIKDVRQLLHLGSPIAVNFFRVKFDENSDKYLHEVYAKFS